MVIIMKGDSEGAVAMDTTPASGDGKKPADEGKRAEKRAARKEKLSKLRSIKKKGRMGPAKPRKKKLSKRQKAKRKAAEEAKAKPKRKRIHTPAPKKPAVESGDKDEKSEAKKDDKKKATVSVVRRVGANRYRRSRALKLRKKYYQMRVERIRNIKQRVAASQAMKIRYKKALADAKAAGTIGKVKKIKMEEAERLSYNKLSASGVKKMKETKSRLAVQAQAAAYKKPMKRISYYAAELKPKLRAKKYLGTNPKTQYRAKKPLRASLTPGTLVILLTGVHRGRRVVFLKQLDSKLLLVTGPFKFNRCPLRRIMASRVIATSTKIDISNVKLPDHINDEYFRRKRRKMKRAEGDVFEKTEKKKYEASEQRKADQAVVDAEVIKAIKADKKEKKNLKSYLSTKFMLRRNDAPHLMIF